MQLQLDDEPLLRGSGAAVIQNEDPDKPSSSSSVTNDDDDMLTEEDENGAERVRVHSHIAWDNHCSMLEFNSTL